MCARYAWVLWTGTASALQSSGYGNVDPVSSWTKLSTAAEYLECVAQRNVKVDEFLRGHPQASKRKEDVLFEKKTIPGDEEDETMVIYTATSFLCLPGDVDPAKKKAEQLEQLGLVPPAGAAPAGESPSGQPPAGGAPLGEAATGVAPGSEAH